MADEQPPPATSLGKKRKSGFDLRGKNVNTLSDSVQRKSETIVIHPNNLSQANFANFWSFTFRARKNQWIRLKPESLTVLLWGRQDNATRNIASLDLKEKAQYHSLNAKAGVPEMFLDPTIQASGFVKGVDVYINNVLVTSNGTLNNHLLHYSRVSRIFQKRGHQIPVIKTMDEIEYAKKTKTMASATKAFTYGAWNSERGVRIPIYLNGIFPFEFKNKTIASIDNELDGETLYFPPETSFEIRVHLFKDKIESVFHAGIDDVKQTYFTSTAALPVPNNLLLTFQDVSLEYEATELNPAEQVKAMAKLEQGAIATYTFDVPRIQYQSLPAGQSYTTNTFQIYPMARLLYILFLPNWGTFVMDSKKKPLSGLSQFPLSATSIKLSFGSDPNLICDTFEEFGIRGSQHNITKKIYYEYLKERNIFPFEFDDLFPDNADTSSTLQIFVYDLQHQMSLKSELLTIQCTFGQAQTSPEELQILCISVHPNGKGTCKFNSHSSNYLWEFSPLS